MRPPSRNAILALTMAADVLGALLIVFVVPLAWSTSLIVLAVYLAVVNALSRLYLRRSADG
jgi:hypothetical protein